jgi:type IV pilus assembly protein PilB
VRHAIILEKSASEIKDVAITDTGMKTLRQDGLEKALQGHTTLEEILSATNE